MNEADVRELELRWKRDRLSRELSGDREGGESDSDTPPTPLSREELKSLLSKRDKGAKS